MTLPRPKVTKDYPEWAAGQEGFIMDFRQALAEAVRAGDDGGGAALNTLWLDNFEDRLGRMKPSRLKKYLATRQVWRSTNVGGVDRPVYKAGSEPCIVFSADAFADGSIDLIAIGACYRYPNGENTWWTDVIEPRARTL